MSESQKQFYIRFAIICGCAGLIVVILSLYYKTYDFIGFAGFFWLVGLATLGALRLER